MARGHPPEETTLSAEPPVLIDLDGTLVDSVYLHVVCWHEALTEMGRQMPMWRIHQGIGMGSDRMLPWLLGEHPGDADELAEGHTSRFLDRAGQLRPTHGAVELVHDLGERDVPFIIATSAGQEERAALLEALGMPDLETTDAGDVPSSKPAPHLLESSAKEIRADVERTTLIGDSPWDAEAASRIGMRAVGVRTGGFGDSELMRAGCRFVVDDPRQLIGRL